MTKQIPLTRGKFAIVDNHWFEYLNQWRWLAMPSSSTGSFYAARYDKNREYIAMARLIKNTPRGMECDHINHDTLDNREENLRNVTSQENQWNRKTASNNQLGEKCIVPCGKGYRVQLFKMGKRVFDKCFKTLDAAKQARDEALKKNRGEFAHTGKIEVQAVRDTKGNNILDTQSLT
jgi:hypothetical protein